MTEELLFLRQSRQVWRCTVLSISSHTLQGAVTNPSTLFHLLPLNDQSHEVLNHPDNQRFVSLAHGKEPGLEVGFHVAAVPNRVISRLGRDADLIRRARTVSAVHIAFELHPKTRVILLSVRSKRISSVSVTPTEKGVREEAVRGEVDEKDCVLSHGKSYDINIVAYEFGRRWRHSASPKTLRKLSIQDYEKALQQQRHIRLRYLPTERDSNFQLWHYTRLHSVRRLLFCELEGKSCHQIGHR